MTDKITFEFDSPINQTDKDRIQKSLQNLTTNSPTFSNWLNALKSDGVTNIIFGTRKVDDMSGITSSGSDEDAAASEIRHANTVYVSIDTSKYAIVRTDAFYDWDSHGIPPEDEYFAKFDPSHPTADSWLESKDLTWDDVDNHTTAYYEAINEWSEEHVPYRKLSIEELIAHEVGHSYEEVGHTYSLVDIANNLLESDAILAANIIAKIDCYG